MRPTIRTCIFAIVSRARTCVLQGIVFPGSVSGWALLLRPPTALDISSLCLKNTSVVKLTRPSFFLARLALIRLTNPDFDKCFAAADQGLDHHSSRHFPRNKSLKHQYERLPRPHIFQTLFSYPLTHLCAQILSNFPRTPAGPTLFAQDVAPTDQLSHVTL